MIGIQCSPQEITYAVAQNGESIMFFPCRVVSHNPHDVANKYCPYCHRFMDLLDVVLEMHRPGAASQG
jgi:hypothetical protein